MTWILILYFYTAFQLDDDCNQDPEYSLTQCLKNYINNKIKCSLQWFGPETDEFPKCMNNEQILETKVK